MTRFWSKVDRGKRSACWPWRSYLMPNGYGQFRHDGKARLAHRVAYELLVGPIPPGLTLDHLCRNRACCNPAHMEPVTRGENVLRGISPVAANARKTRCPRGHPYDEANTVHMEGGGRWCRACRGAGYGGGGRIRRTA